MSDPTPTYPLLIVDDDRDHAEAVSDMLEEYGWKPTIMDSGAAAVEWLQDKGNCVVLCDYNMPGMNGIQVLQQVDHSRVGFVMLTGLNDPNVVADALRYHCDDYAFKPVNDWDALNKKLSKVGDGLRRRTEAQRENDKLSQMADWQAWKASFLKADQEDDMQELLRMLHVQFNQDANFSQLLDLVEAAAKVDPSKSMRVKVPIDILHLVVSALRPIARFSDGIGIAASLLGDAPQLRSVPVSEFEEELLETWVPQWKEKSELRSNRFSIHVDNNLKYSGHRWLKLDKDSFFKALNEVVVNSMKHSDRESTILVSFSVSDSELCIVVTNSLSNIPAKVGTVEIYGLPREFESQAFRLFYRLKDSAAITIYEEDWPMGLGLPLVKSVFLAAGGSITVRNETWHLSGSPEPEVLVTARGSVPLFDEPPIPLEEESDDDDDLGLELF